MKRMFSILALATVMFPWSAEAKPRTGWTKVMVSRMGALPLDDTALRSVGAERIQSYGERELLYVPAQRLAALVDLTRGIGMLAEPVDEFDTVIAPGARVDARAGLAQTIARRPEYAADETGLYIVQFHGPLLKQWLEAIRSANVVPARYLPHNAYIVAATPADFATIREFSFIQWSDLYHPALKPLDVSTSSFQPDEVIVDLINQPGVAKTIALLRSVAPNSVVRYRQGDVTVRALIPASEFDRILAEPLVLGIQHVPDERISDERQAFSMTDLHDGQAPPIPAATRYSAWLSGRCSTCASASWRLGVADTGVDNGDLATLHPDLLGRVEFGRNFIRLAEYSDRDEGPEDGNGHGTMVAGLAIGNASQGGLDANGYFNGMGVAPSARLISTKIIASNGLVNTNWNISHWAYDATSRGVFFQTHSHNDYYIGQGQCTVGSHGKYTMESREFDQAVRDANIDPIDGLNPITLTVSTGNMNQSTCPNAHLTLPPATAKNVISVGSAENYRPEKNPLNCAGTKADSYRNISSTSCRGTLVTGVFKPDVVVPATMTVSGRSQFFTPAQTTRPAFCEPWFNNGSGTSQWYSLDSGTSFAAPAALSAAMLASRKFSATEGAASPALNKAMLVGGTVSLAGGIDRHTLATISFRPKAEQGFGRVSLAEILDATPARQYLNQSWTFTSSANPTWSQTYTIDDPAKKVKVVLAWTDAPGTAGGTGSQLVNNLNLRVNLLTCSYYVGNAFSGDDVMPLGNCSTAPAADTKNNVELVVFSKPEGGTFTVNVIPAAINGKAIPNSPNATDQDFALYVYNAR